MAKIVGNVVLVLQIHKSLQRVRLLLERGNRCFGLGPEEHICVVWDKVLVELVKIVAVFTYGCQ